LSQVNRLTKFVPSNQGEDESGLSSEDNADRNNEDKLRKEKKTCLVKRNRNDPDPEQQIAAPGEGRERSESFGDIDDDLTDESTMLGEHHLMAEKEIGNENGNLENHAIMLFTRINIYKHQNPRIVTSHN
jgi:hypothetical protein